jgi:hypothetical protein
MTHRHVAVFTHRGLGQMIRLTVVEGYSFDLTMQEAQILSRALAAVKDKKSPVDEVYMSPIASDGDFVAKVLPDGVIFEARTPPVKLAWPDVGDMAAELAAASKAEEA